MTGRKKSQKREVIPIRRIVSGMLGTEEVAVFDGKLQEGMAPAEVEFFANVAAVGFDGSWAHRAGGGDFLGG